MRGKLRPCRVRETGQLYRSVRAALMALGLPPADHYERALAGMTMAGRWHIELLDENDPDYVVARAVPIRRRRVRQVRCLDTGTVYDSVRAAAAAHHITAEAVRKAAGWGTRCVGMRWEYVVATEVAS